MMKQRGSRGAKPSKSQHHAREDSVTVSLLKGDEERSRSGSHNVTGIDVEGNVRKLPAPDKRKIVKIGLNLIGLSEIDDINETFVANFLFQIEHPKGFEPWQMWKTAVEMNTLDNPGIPEGGFKKGTDRVLKIKNYVGKFSNPLQLQNFPFDVQKLRLTLVLNDTETINLTQTSPGSLKANLEFDTLAEWDILRIRRECPAYDGVINDKTKQYDVCKRCNTEVEFHEACKKFVSGLKGRDKCTKCGFPADYHKFWKRRDRIRPHAVSIQEIIQASPTLSAQNQSYYNLNFAVVVQRKFKPILYNVVFPTFILALSSFSIYAVEAVETVGDRLAILFTVVLSLVTNQVRTRDRLPNIEYLTVIDKFMWAMQGFVYLVASGVVGVALLCEGDNCKLYDYYVFWGNLAAFVATNLYFMLVAFVQLRERRRKVYEIRKKYNEMQEKMRKEEEEANKPDPEKGRPKVNRGGSVSQLAGRAIGSDD